MSFDHPAADHVEDPTISSTIGSTTNRTTAPVQIVARMSPRRRWSTDEKRAMVEATYDPGSSVAEVAECFEVSPAQLYSWRRQVAEGTLDQSRRSMPSFALVELAEDLPALPIPAAQPGAIRIVLPDGISLVIEGVVDEAVIERVIMALRR
jgi:transposase